MRFYQEDKKMSKEFPITISSWTLGDQQPQGPIEKSMEK